MPGIDRPEAIGAGPPPELELRVRRIHRRDLNRVWAFLKLVFRDVGRQTVEYQRPRLKKHFFEIYEEEGIEQLLFEVRKGGKHELVGYAEYAYEIVGSDNWMNERYFEKRDMRPLFVQELAVHPDYHGLGVGDVRLTGRAPNGQCYVMAPKQLWVVANSTAVLRGRDLGPSGPLLRQARLGDFRMPQRGIGMVGSGHFETFDADRHMSPERSLTFA